MKTLLKGASFVSLLALPTYVMCQNNQEPSPPAKLFKKRQNHLQQLEANPTYDIVVIGGGCNGAGVLLDASTRGFRTLLIQKNDFGSGSSSKSTKLIHGGVRYLQQVFALDSSSLSSRWQKFKLVKEAIRQRGFMIRNGSYMNKKIPFIIPCQNSFQTFYYYVGSVAYYAIYWICCPSGTTHFNFPYLLHREDLRQIYPYISDKYTSGVVYEDGCFNDARMLLMSLLTAALSKSQHQSLPKTHIPANILNKAQLINFIKNSDGKIEGVEFRDNVSGKLHKIKAKYVVNCTGTWADEIRKKDDPQAKNRMCIVGGSHITYNPDIGNLSYGLCLPSKDGRILLVVPWLKKIIAGTTQRKYEFPVTNPTISLEERKFINETLSQTLEKLEPSQLIRKQISRWTGLRPLVMNVKPGKQMNTKDISRTHVIEKSSSGLLSLMGGKWTTYRKMGEDLVEEIVQEEKAKGHQYPSSMTQDLYLAGYSTERLQQSLTKQFGQIGDHLYTTYGSLALNIINGDLRIVKDNLTMAELNHIVENEMVNDVEDVLIRRTRATFLNNKSATLSLIPIVAEMLLKREQGVAEDEKLRKLVEESMERISSYEFD